jgi:hypothetical protein
MTQAAMTQGTRIPLVSICPRCGCEQAQWFSQLALLTRLQRGHAVEGYCVACQNSWQLSSDEHVHLAAKLSG